MRATNCVKNSMSVRKNAHEAGRIETKVFFNSILPMSEVGCSCCLVALSFCGAVARFFAGSSGCLLCGCFRGLALTFLAALLVRTLLLRSCEPLIVCVSHSHRHTHTQAGGCLLFGLNTRIIDAAVDVDADAEAAISRRSNKGPQIVLIGEVYTICAYAAHLFLFLWLLLLVFLLFKQGA